METIKYPFGETPEDVIRERAAACREIPLIDLTPWQMVAGAKPDDLLTVLDALVDADNEMMNVQGAWHEQGAPEPKPQYVKDAEDQQTRYRILRIEILAALGSDEGGE